VGLYIKSPKNDNHFVYIMGFIIGEPEWKGLGIYVEFKWRLNYMTTLTLN
jgi:hypothetical protein